MKPWLRKIDVTLGPLEEWRGADKGQVIGMTSDGTPGGLRIACKIEKTLMGVAKSSTITLYNLAGDTRGAIQAGLSKITVMAGYANGEQPMAFQGSVMAVAQERSGSDILTKIEAIPGYGAMVRGVTSATWGERTPVRQVVIDLAKNLPGVTVDPTKITGIDGQIDGGGYSYAGSTKSALSRLAEEQGFSWSVNDGVFQAVGDDSTMGDGAWLLNGDGGPLISVSPIQAGPPQITPGVTIKAIYVPGIVPGQKVEVRSTISPKLNGFYKVGSISINLDAYSPSWNMDIQSTKTGS